MGSLLEFGGCQPQDSQLAGGTILSIWDGKSIHGNCASTPTAFARTRRETQDPIANV
jgi:hypothetical protein